MGRGKHQNTLYRKCFKTKTIMCLHFLKCSCLRCLLHQHSQVCRLFSILTQTVYLFLFLMSKPKYSCPDTLAFVSEAFPCSPWCCLLNTIAFMDASSKWLTSFPSLLSLSPVTSKELQLVSPVFLSSSNIMISELPSCNESFL